MEYTIIVIHKIDSNALKAVAIVKDFSHNNKTKTRVQNCLKFYRNIIALVVLALVAQKNTKG